MNPSESKSSDDPQKGLEIALFERTVDWLRWLNQHHAVSDGIWLRLAKKASSLKSVTYDEALEGALCYGWIDGQKKAFDADSWIQRFTPRRKRSIWSKINREKALRLIKDGKMQPSGFAEIERAKADERWGTAYDSMKNASVPDDLQLALSANPQASEFFATLNNNNRYAILFRIQTAKKAETRARRIEQFISMLQNHETIYPQSINAARDMGDEQ
jgi:uncharacterized protein YdeI (YjbR/CyaY-like superfamily)